MDEPERAAEPAPSTSAARSRRSPSTERDIARGRMPERPFVLVGQQYLADPTRSAGDIHPLWAYAHVPHGYTGDATEAILAQIERFAPGFRDRIVARAVTPDARSCRRTTRTTSAATSSPAPTPTGSSSCGPGSRSTRTAPAIPGTFICSAASPPGAGAHGMCGYHAAGSALRHLRIDRRPDER